MKKLFLAISFVVIASVHAQDAENPAAAAASSVPPTPSLRAIRPATLILPMDIPPLPDAVETKDEDERMCQVAEGVYFRHSHTSVRATIHPILKKLIKDAHNSPEREHREGIDSLRRILSGVADINDQKAVKYIHDMVTKATQDALSEQQKQIDVLRKSTTSKRKTGAIAIISAVAAAITAIAGSIGGLYGSGTC